ncbi:NiFe hydrogenase [Shewanella alkalitolerans]|uniref:NiFe hydrogenase n=1 Tax=Shewanella alkalitolerans TaxID=2864209 RepID=UPI001C658E01|nr:NiFe hydrogenase [Shewanella alkalitolerans]QYJ99296.1 NiFe hydrogenase [Shewanella alkalitolerans]
MKTIKFEFTCSRQVPLYAHLCNRYLNYGELNIHVGYQGGAYFIEAEGKQSELEGLADDIAQDFLISVWLTDSRIALIDAPTGSKAPLATQPLVQEFCQQCAPHFGDNQAPEFGQLDLACDCCHGERRIHQDYRGLTAGDIQAMYQRLMTQGELELAGGIRLSLSPVDNSPDENSSNKYSQRPRLLICNPNTLNAQFHLSDPQVLALSSIEKPLICVRPIKDHPKLAQPLYDLCFAYNRLLVILTEHLRQHGTDWVYLIDPAQGEALAYIDGQWAEIHTNAPSCLRIDSPKQPLHDTVLLAGKDTYYYASHSDKQGGHYLLEQGCDVKSRHGAMTPAILGDDDLALCALHSVNLEHGLDKNSAIIYLSRDHGGQIYTLDGKCEAERFFALPELPENGYEIYHQLEQSPQRKVLEKFKQRYPEDYLRLLDLKLPNERHSLSALWAVGAVILGLESRSLSVGDLNDALMAAAMAHRGSNSPRIDYPLTRGEAYRSLNWCKTLGSLISFRLADDRDSQKLAFGMHDSFADYLANWIEHLDLNLGVKSVALAGSEWVNPLLCQRVALRVGKNFPLKHNQLLEIDGNNHAIGALLLKKRRL